MPQINVCGQMDVIGDPAGTGLLNQLPDQTRGRQAVPKTAFEKEQFNFIYKRGQVADVVQVARRVDE